jgi:hypothetical protein
MTFWFAERPYIITGVYVGRKLFISCPGIKGRPNLIISLEGTSPVNLNISQTQIEPS